MEGGVEWEGWKGEGAGGSGEGVRGGGIHRSTSSRVVEVSPGSGQQRVRSAARPQLLVGSGWRFF